MATNLVIARPTVVVTQEPEASDIEKVASALRGKAVRFTYDDGRGKVTKRSVSNVTLVVRDGSPTHVHGWDERAGAVRMFRMAGITGLEVL